MTDIAGRVRAATGGLESAIQAAATALADPEVITEAVGSAAHTIAEAEAAWAAMERTAAGAFKRYPEFHDTGVHGGDVDSRAIPLLATPTYIEKAGMYSAQELKAMAAEGRAPEAWVAREALRLTAFLAALERLVAGLDDATLPATAYADAVAGLVRDFAALRVAG